MHPSGKRYDWDKHGKTVLEMSKTRSAMDIAQLTGISKQAIIYYLQKHGIQPRIREYKRTDWKAIHNDVVAALQEKPACQVAAEFDINFNTLMAYCQRNKIPRPVKKEREEMLDMELYAKVRNLYEKSMSPTNIALRLNTTERAVNDAINNIYRSAGDAEIKAARVYCSEFRRRIGPWMDRVFAQGAIVINSEKRGEAVLMTAAKFNEMKTKADAFDQAKR